MMSEIKAPGSAPEVFYCRLRNVHLAGTDVRSAHTIGHFPSSFILPIRRR